MLATLNNWNLSRKMLVAFTLIGVLMIAVATAGIVTNTRLGEIAETHVSSGLAGTTAIGDVLTQIREQRIIVYSRHNAIDAGEVAKLTERLAKNQAALVADVAEYRRVAGKGFEPEVDNLAAILTRLNGAAERTFAVRETGVAESLAIIKTEGKAASHDAIAAAELLLKKTIDRAHAGNTDGKAYASLALTMAIGLTCVALVGLVGVWLVIARTVAGPMASLAATTTELAGGAKAQVPSLDRGDELGQIARAVQSFSEASASRADSDAAAAADQAEATAALGDSLRAMSEGDLTLAVTAEFAPAYQALKTDLNQALGSLSGLIGSVSDGVSAIRTGSVEIAQASEDLARRTESNAASLEETSAALVQIETRLRATAASSKGTVARADQAIASVGTGRATAEGAMQAMTRVSSSAKGIDSVIEGVDKIAFQTRVLAMNAAVEAGRAGDAGRGFAVVADLVSALAMRAEEEAKRARDQLTVTQAEIVIAVDAVQKVDGALSDISGDVDAVHKLLASMADDNLAQSAAITQITSAVGSMDKATQQNAAMVEETSAAARNLTVEVAGLAEQAGQFRTGAGGGTIEVAPARRAKAPATARPIIRSVPAPVARRAAGDRPKARANGRAVVDSADWSDF